MKTAELIQRLQAFPADTEVEVVVGKSNSIEVLWPHHGDGDCISNDVLEFRRVNGEKPVLQMLVYSNAGLRSLRNKNRDTKVSFK
jgi:hypothetical protein